MGKKLFIPLAEKMKPRFTVACFLKALFGASPLAGGQNVTLPAPTGKNIFFAHTESRLERFLHHVRQRVIHDIAETVLGIDAVVAGIHISIMLNYD